MANSGVKQETVQEFIGFCPGTGFTLRMFPDNLVLTIKADRGPGMELSGSAVRVLFELLTLANDEEGLK